MNTYAKEEKVIIDYKFNINHTFIGTNNIYSELCSCKRKEFYYFISDYAGELTPVVCGNCNGRIPLTLFPYINNESEHFTTISWMRMYERVYYLFNLGLSDKFFYYQIHNIESELSKIGREIVNQFEINTQIPCYYPLIYYEETINNCPSCHQKWTYDDFYYKCNTCRLIAFNNS